MSLAQCLAQGRGSAQEVENEQIDGFRTWGFSMLSAELQAYPPAGKTSQAEIQGHTDQLFEEVTWVACWGSKVAGKDGDG